MKRKNLGKLKAILITSLTILALAGCSDSTTDSTSATSSTTESNNIDTSSDNDSDNTAVELNAMLDTTDMFSDRDLLQTPDTSEAESITLVSGEDVTIKEEGVYIISGNVEDVTIIVEAAEDAKVQLVLDGVNIVNEDAPAIYVKTADKVFVTTTDSDNSMEVTGTYTSDGETNLDAVIFSKSDITFNGTGTLNIVSALGNGISGKDDIKITGGTYNIDSKLDGIEANDSIRVYDGTITVNTDKDAFHSENEDDGTLGYIYIQGGTFNITAAEDGIQGTSVVQIDGGTINIISCLEGIEATYVQINDGIIDIYSTDDGINAANKSSYYDVVIEFNGGNITIVMASGDTDAVDANGYIYVNGGTIDITAPTSSFDFDIEAELNGGDVTVNGEVLTEIVESMMGGPGGGGKMGGGKPGWN